MKESIFWDWFTTPLAVVGLVGAIYLLFYTGWQVSRLLCWL